VYTFTVPDGVTVGSLAGLETGWGYSLHNESSSLWLVTTDLSAGTFRHATPDLIFDFPDLAPGATVTLPYNPVPPAAGLYQILWNQDVPAGLVNAGTFTLSAEWWNGDPLAGGSFVGTAPSASQPYTATVTPEPVTIGLAAIFFSIFCTVGFLRRRGLTSTTLQDANQTGFECRISDRIS
jgi:hypothetical protein